MQFLKISNKLTLSELANQVGSRNVDSILALNGLPRTPKIGQAYEDKYNQVVQSTASVEPQTKLTRLNSMTSDSDVFETAALLNNDDWRYLEASGSLPGTLKIPETITLPDSTSIIGNGQPVSRTIYDKAIAELTVNMRVDPSVFNEYSSRKGSTIVDTTNSTGTMQWFKLPWGLITLHSSISGDSIDFPVYPEEFEDGVQANYDNMPDTLYQYEPWQVYKSSGPRSNPYTFKMHRDMWTGDHRDGKCNELIRFCEANCYPEFRGAAVHTAIVTLYIAGKPLISGIMNSVKTKFEGPIGLDDYPLVCELQLTITEVSPESLNYTKVLEKGLIG